MKIGDKVIVNGVGGDFSCLDGAVGRISEILDSHIYTHPFIVIFEPPVQGLDSINLLAEEMEVIV